MNAKKKYDELVTGGIDIEPIKSNELIGKLQDLHVQYVGGLIIEDNLGRKCTDVKVKSEKIVIDFK